MRKPFYSVGDKVLIYGHFHVIKIESDRLIRKNIQRTTWHEGVVITTNIHQLVTHLFLKCTA